MLKTVAVRQLKPNPFRRLDEYPIIREKVDALKESIGQTGFWGNIVGRERGPHIEIAYGHHRLVALQEALGPAGKVEVIVRDLSNEYMIKMMAAENMEEWGTSAWVELETIRSVIDAYGKGEIALPKVPAKTREDLIRHVSHDSGTHSYTVLTVATFLGWTRKHRGDGLQPNFACETAFKALDMIDAGLLDVSKVKGIQRKQLEALVRGVWGIHQTELKAAKFNAEEAKRAADRAARATKPAERARHEQSAATFATQARQHETEAIRKPARFAEDSSELLRSGQASFRDVDKKAEEMRLQVPQAGKVHNIDQYARRITRKLEALTKDEILTKDFNFVMQHAIDLSADEARGMMQSLSSLIDRLEAMRRRLAKIKGCHATETRSNHVQRAIENGRD